MTTSIPNQTRLFGMDLSQWPMQWRAAGAMLLGLPALRGLTPPVRVDLLRADGGRSFWDVAHGRAQPAAPGAGAALLAVELPRDQVLDRQFTLPRLTPADVARAVRLEVDAATPFDPEQTVFGYAATPTGDTLRIDLAMASRAHVERRLQSVATVGDDSTAAPEVWVLPSTPFSADFRPIEMQGFGEGERRRVAARGRNLRLALLALALLLLLAIAFTPTLQSRLRAIQAQKAFDGLQTQVAPQVALRESLTKQSERLKSVGDIASHQMAWLPVLNMLTRAVPDGAWLNSLRIEGNKVVINGNGDDAAALVQRLASQPGVRDVRLLSPATRAGGALKEVFNIEMNLDPKTYALARPRGAP